MKATRDFSDKQEKRVARKLGGHVQVGSGSTPFLKGDVIVDDWLLECKTKTSISKAHTIRKDWLTKAREQAFGNGLSNYALVFDFGDGEDYVAVDIATFQSLLYSSQK